MHAVCATRKLYEDRITHSKHATYMHASEHLLRYGRLVFSFFGLISFGVVCSLPRGARNGKGKVVARNGCRSVFTFWLSFLVRRVSNLLLTSTGLGGVLGDTSARSKRGRRGSGPETRGNISVPPPLPSLYQPPALTCSHRLILV